MASLALKTPVPSCLEHYVLAPYTVSSAFSPASVCLNALSNSQWIIDPGFRESFRLSGVKPAVSAVMVQFLGESIVLTPPIR